MRIIISPAKRMRRDTDIVLEQTEPVFAGRAEEVLEWLRTLSGEELQELWGCSERIARESCADLWRMDLSGPGIPAILSYDGIAYTYMAPEVFTDRMYAYAQEHLRILSALYGVLRPLDGVQPYRLEMNQKGHVRGTRSLYAYWGDAICKEVTAGDEVVLNLASAEYWRCISRHLQKGQRMITCTFGQLIDGRVVTKGVYAKMARGDMVRYLAEREITDPGELCSYDRMGYRYRAELSSENELVFVTDQGKR